MDAYDPAQPLSRTRRQQLWVRLAIRGAIFVGLLLLVGGIFGLRPALDAKALGTRYWPAALACSIVGIVLGVAMLAGCFSAVSAVFWICGMALLIYGLEQAVVIINLLRN